MNFSVLRRLAKEIRSSLFGYFLFIFAAALLAACVSLMLAGGGDRVAHDVEIFALTPSQPLDPDVVIVAIDEKTLARFPYRSPVDRAFLSDLLNAIAGKHPRAIGLDILLDQPTEPAKDAALRKTLRGMPVPLFAAYADDTGAINQAQLNYLNQFLPPRSRAYVNVVTTANDAIVRRIYPGALDRRGHYILSFPRALVESTGVKTPDNDIEMVWRGKPDDSRYAFAMYPAQDAASLPADWIRNKIVLVGSDLNQEDRHRTPFSNAQQPEFPGVVLHAYAISQLLHGNSARTLPSWQAQFAIATLVALLGAALGAAGWNLALRLAVLSVLVATLLCMGVTIAGLWGLFVGLISPALAAVLAFFVADSIAGSEARGQRAFVQGAFSRYVSPRLVEQLMRDPESLTLDGQRRSMTFIFTDVKDFTAMSEKLDPKELPRILNAYLDGITRIVLEQDGMVDKFIGDAVFAIFNALVDQPDHAQRGVKCALAIDAFSSRFTVEQNAAGVPFGITRIGVHTGVATIGNFGSSARFTYTAQGDAVNTAARLESLNKHFGTHVCTSGATRENCEATLLFRPVATVVLKGKTDAVDVHQPLVRGQYDGAYLARYEMAFAQLREKSGDALLLFQALRDERPDDPCVALHLERLARGETGVTILMDAK